MDMPNPNYVGPVSFALVSALIDRLIASGALSGVERAAIIELALEKVPARDTRGFIKPVRAYLESAIKALRPRE